MVYLNGKNEKDYCANYIHWECTVPTVQEEKVVIPLRDGYVSLTTSLSPVLKYNSRTIKIDLELRSFPSEWPMYHSQLLRDLHGQEVKVARSEDPDYFYVGIASVGDLQPHGATAGVSIIIDAQPFKRTEAWVEDTAFTVSGAYTHSIDNEFMRGYPVFDCATTGVTVTLGGETWTLPVGESEAYGMVLPEGQSDLVFAGSGSVDFRWRGGLL